MLGKFKQVGNDVKKSMGDLKAHTEIEAEYLKAKSKGFEHTPDVTTHIKIATDIQMAYEELLSCVVDWVDKYQAVINSEVKTAERFKERVAIHQQQQTSVIVRNALQYAEYQKEVQQLRQTQLGFVLEYVQLPVKKMVSETLSFKAKLEALNKASVEVKYWKSKATQVRQYKEAQILYDSNGKSFVEFVTGLRQLSERDFPQKLAAFQQAQVEFFSTASNITTLLDTFQPGYINDNSNSNSNSNSITTSDEVITLAKSRTGSLGGDEYVRSRSRSASASAVEDENHFEKVDIR